MANEYEELLKAGYTEEEIELLDDFSEMNIYDSPMGPDREDKGVSVTNTEGKGKRTSSIMLGHNKQGIVLENGEYVSWEEVEDALDISFRIEKDEDIVYVCKKTGKVVDPQTIIDCVHEISTEKAHFYREPSDAIDNQVADRVIVRDGGKEYPKGVSMLGNDGFTLTSGEYVSREEIERALDDYVKMRGPEPIYDVVEKFYRKISWIPNLIATIGVIISGFGSEEVIETYTSEIEALKAAYNTTAVVDTIDTAPSLEYYEEVYGDVAVGESVNVEEGVPYYESSDYKYGGADANGVIGEGVRDPGEYTVDRFAVLHEGRIVEHKWEDGDDLSEVLQELSDTLGVPVEELEPMIHLNGPVTGWVSINDVIDASNKDGHLDRVDVILDDSKNYEGIVENFNGDTITINNDGADVILKVVNEDGSYVKPGDIVVGSDGQQYQINSFGVEKGAVQVYEEQVVGTKVNWSFKNITAEEALASAGIAAVGAYLSLKKRKDMTEMTETQIDGLIAEAESNYVAARDDFDTTSSFEDAARGLVKKQPSLGESAADMLKEELIRQQISVEDVRNLGESNNSEGAKKN